MPAGSLWTKINVFWEKKNSNLRTTTYIKSRENIIQIIAIFFHFSPTECNLSHLIRSNGPNNELSGFLLRYVTINVFYLEDIH